MLTRPRLAAAALVATLLAGTLDGPAGAVDAGAAPAHRLAERRIANAVLTLLNHERSRHHLPALTSNAHLVTSAHAHDVAMARKNLLSHQVPGEPALGTRETRAGYRWTWAGENIGWNSEMDKKGVLALERLMYDEKPPNDGHRRNILFTHYRNVGVDVYLDAAHHKVWLTTDFGRH